MTSPRPTAETIEERLREHTARLLDAIDDTRHDRVRNMARLESEVAALCRDIGRLPPEQAALLGPPMAEMIGRLEELIYELRAFQGRAGLLTGGDTVEKKDSGL